MLTLWGTKRDYILSLPHKASGNQYYVCTWARSAPIFYPPQSNLSPHSPHAIQWGRKFPQVNGRISYNDISSAPQAQLDGGALLPARGLSMELTEEHLRGVQGEIPRKLWGIILLWTLAGVFSLPITKLWTLAGIFSLPPNHDNTDST